MKRILLYLCLCFTSLLSCKKKEKDSCETGVVVYVNDSPYRFKLYLDGNHFTTIEGGKTAEGTIEKGFHQLHAIQESNIIVAPTTADTFIFLNGCDSAFF